MIISKEREERQQWLNSLKVGDVVAVSFRIIGGVNHRISKIQKITPSRMFILDTWGSVKFSNNGYQQRSATTKMVPITQEVKNNITRNDSIRFLDDFMWRSLSTQQLLDILKIIHGEEEIRGNTMNRRCTCEDLV